jgi:hypothetical protein
MPAPSQTVGDQALEARIAEQVNHAARIRESMARISRSKTNLELAASHKPFQGKDSGEHAMPEYKRNR